MVKTWPFTIFLFKARTTKEVRDYLTKYEIESGIIDKVVHHLKEDKWLDDRQYAKKPDRGQPPQWRYGPALLQQKIQQKGSQNLSFKKYLQTMIFQK